MKRVLLALGVLSLPVLSMTATSGVAEPIARTRALDNNFQAMVFQPEADLLNVALGFSRRYEDVAFIGGANIDALVTLVAISGLTSNVLDTFDQYDNGPNLSAHTKPSGTAEASAKFRIDFLVDNTNTPAVIDNVSLSIADIDAWEFVSFAGITGYQLATGTQLSVTTTNGVSRFISSASGVSNTDELRIVQATYATASSVSVSFGCRANAVTNGVGAGGKCGFTIPVGNFLWTNGSTATAVTRPSFQITYNGNSGTGSVPSPTSGSGALTIESNTGGLIAGSNSFLGWNTKADGTGISLAPGDTFVPSENITFYAQYGSAQAAHTVTFMNNGGSGTMTPQTSGVAASLTSNTFTYSGFTFAGWNTDPNGNGTAYVDGVSYAFTADLTLYAQWVAITATTVATTLPPATTIAPAVTVAPVATTVAPASVATVHTVTFNSNGGKGSMSNQVSGVTSKLKSNIFSRSGYKFAGWNTATDGTGTSYVNATSYGFATDLVLYAQWTPNAESQAITPSMPKTGATIPMRSIACLLFAGGLMVWSSRRRAISQFEGSTVRASF